MSVPVNYIDINNKAQEYNFVYQKRSAIDLREAAKSYFVSGPATKRGEGEKAGPLRKKNQKKSGH